MLTSAPMPLQMPLTETASGFPQWVRANKGAVSVAGLLALAGPLTFFTGALGVMREPIALNIVRLGIWWTLYGIVLWCMLLVTGYLCERHLKNARWHARGALWLAAACTAAAFANILTAGRAPILIEQGLVASVGTMHLHGFIISLTMALLYFAHLRSSRAHQEAKARLAAAQTAQRNARLRMVQLRVQEVQARIDPGVLFEMLEVVRRLYQTDPTRAETFLDELIAFLRAALPRLRAQSSSLVREAELAGAFARLNAIAADSEFALSVDIAPDALHARFPPGVLLPLLHHAVGGGARCRLTASRLKDTCLLVLMLGSAPPDHCIERVRSLLTELYGEAGNLLIEKDSGAVNVKVKVPYELA